MIGERIRLNNKSAVCKEIAYLRNFRLDFVNYSKRWCGACTTVVPAENFVVWGFIWELDNSDMPMLDYQEGVSEKKYFPTIVSVETTNGTVLQCRIYQQYKNPEDDARAQYLQHDRRPSPLYLNIVIQGARENNLPPNYITFLETIANNGYSGKYQIRHTLICEHHTNLAYTYIT